MCFDLAKLGPQLRGDTNLRVPPHGLESRPTVLVIGGYLIRMAVGGDEVLRNVRVRSDVTCAPAAASRCAPAAAAFVVLAAVFRELMARLLAPVHCAHLCGVGEERVLDRLVSGHL